MYNLNDYVMNYLSYNTLLQMRNTTSTDLAFKEDKVGNKLYINTAYDKPINISTNAFEGCKSLQKVLFPDCVEELKENLFVNCNSLSYVKLPNNLKSINNSFWRNSNLSSIEYKGIIYTSRSAIEQALTDNGVTYGNNTFDSLGLTD